jgi:hypothetical protein
LAKVKAEAEESALGASVRTVPPPLMEVVPVWVSVPERATVPVPREPKERLPVPEIAPA